MCGKTCYLSGIITKESERGKGIGKKLPGYFIEETAKSAGCRAIILESCVPRTSATASTRAATSKKASPSHQNFSKTTGRLRPRIAGLLPPHRRHGHNLPFFSTFFPKISP
ncbi:GNAT family N-acetyltransferase [Treponema saccharophilum]|uniref:GNAT family N-acetyltransferase n=1 Tax=Treponema saccharophilum TaxID=165 RepID=UPI0038691E72